MFRLSSYLEFVLLIQEREKIQENFIGEVILYFVISTAFFAINIKISFLPSSLKPIMCHLWNAFCHFFCTFLCVSSFSSVHSEYLREYHHTCKIFYWRYFWKTLVKAFFFFFLKKENNFEIQLSAGEISCLMVLANVFCFVCAVLMLALDVAYVTP
jgi:hypothetical protein